MVLVYSVVLKTVDVLILKKALVYLTPDFYFFSLHSKVLYTSCIQLWYTDETYLNHYLMYNLFPHAESRMLFQSWRRSELHDLQGLVVWAASPWAAWWWWGGDTDKRFSFLCVMLMMSVCSDVSVCVWPVLLQIWCVCVFKLSLYGWTEGGRCLLHSCLWSPNVLHGQWTRIGW